MIDIKKFYKYYWDRIYDKRFNSPYPIRKYVHRKEYYSILKYVKEGKRILDVGCGEGIFAILAAKKGAKVTACDISKPNIEGAKKLAKQYGVNDVDFLVADAEHLPFKENTFDLVVCSQVLEHLSNFEKGLTEIRRVTKKRAIIALPTCLNLCALSLLGGAEFWYIRKRSVLALPIGMTKLILNIFKDGVQQGYAGKKELPHLWRFPWVMKRDLRKAGFKIIHFEASSLCLPYFNFLLPLVKFLDRFKSKLFFRNFGYGSIAVVDK